MRKKKKVEGRKKGRGKREQEGRGRSRLGVLAGKGRKRWIYLERRILKEGQGRGLGESTGQPDFPSLPTRGQHHGDGPGSLGGCPPAWSLQRQEQRPQAGPMAPPPGTNTLGSSSRTLARSSDLSLLRQGHKSTRLFPICWVTLALGAASCTLEPLQGGPRGTHSPAGDLGMAPPGSHDCSLAHNLTRDPEPQSPSSAASGFLSHRR